MNTSPFLTRSHLSPKILTLPYSTSSLYPSIPRFQNSFHHRHFHCSLQARLLQLYHNLPKSQITRLQQIQNSLARAVVKAPKSSHITPILRSLHWLKITEHIEYKLLSLTGVPTKFSQPTNLHICMTSSQFSLLAALALHPWSHSLVHPHHHLYE